MSYLKEKDNGKVLQIHKVMISFTQNENFFHPGPQNAKKSCSLGPTLKVHNQTDIIINKESTQDSCLESAEIGFSGLLDKQNSYIG